MLLLLFKADPSWAYHVSIACVVATSARIAGLHWVLAVLCGAGAASILPLLWVGKYATDGRQWPIEAACLLLLVPVWGVAAGAQNRTATKVATAYLVFNILMQGMYASVSLRGAYPLVIEGRQLVGRIDAVKSFNGDYPKNIGPLVGPESPLHNIVSFGVSTSPGPGVDDTYHIHFPVPGGRMRYSSARDHWTYDQLHGLD